MSRLLIIACSQKKRKDTGLLPAIERYDGPAFRVLRKYMREHTNRQLSVYILSAEFGLISGSTPITNYDRILTRERALQIQQIVTQKLQNILDSIYWTEIAFSLSSHYRIAITNDRAMLRGTVLGGGLGERLTKLKQWLLETSYEQHHSGGHGDIRFGHPYI